MPSSDSGQRRQAATARWSINAVSSSYPCSPPSPSAHKIFEHGSIETNELNMTQCDSYDLYESL